MEKSRVYITGIAGFIGSTLAYKLHNEGYHVDGIDDLSSSDGSNVEDAPFCWEYGDFVNSSVDTDVIIHLAANTNAMDSDEDDMIDNNYKKSTIFIKENSDKRFIVASTCLSDLPYQNPYAKSKYLLEVYLRFTTFDYTILRFGNVYGPNQRDWGPEPNVLAAWRKAVSEGKPIRIDGDGKQVRDFIHVDDVCEAIKLSIEKDVSRENISICTGHQVSINELADICYPGYDRIKGDRSPLDYDYIYQDPTPAKHKLGFVAKTQIEDYGKERN